MTVTYTVAEDGSITIDSVSDLSAEIESDDDGFEINFLDSQLELEVKLAQHGHERRLEVEADRDFDVDDKDSDHDA